MKSTHRVTAVVGECYRMVMPYSEVCMHMRIAGKEMLVQPIEGGCMAQIFNLDGTHFSSPVLPSEAGFFRNSDGSRYFHRDQNGVGI